MYAAEHRVPPAARQGHGTPGVSHDCPGAVIGSIIGKEYFASLQLIEKLTDGSLSGCLG